jgi:hypothetical protein
MSICTTKRGKKNPIINRISGYLSINIFFKNVNVDRTVVNNVQNRLIFCFGKYRREEECPAEAQASPPLSRKNKAEN